MRWPLLIAWAALVVLGNVRVADALKDDALWGLLVWLAAYAGVALVTRPRIDPALAATSRVESRLRIGLATVLTMLAVVALTYAAVGHLTPRPDPAGHPTLRIEPVLAALGLGLGAGIVTAVSLARASSHAVHVTRSVFVACAGTAVVFIAT